ncbi:MAG TPA: hypothetical protein VF989_07830 [Polyangiaceae bacterium]
MKNPPCSRAALALSCTLLSACGGQDGGDRSEQAFESFLGIYAIGEYTVNDAACDAEGASAFSTLAETYLVSHRDEFLGVPFLLFFSCSDAADCRDKVATFADGQGVASERSYTLSSAESGHHLTGSREISGFGDGELCRDGGVEALDLVRDGLGIVIELHGRYADFSPDEAGICWSDRGAAAAEGAPCTRFEVLRATFSEAL